MIFAEDEIAAEMRAHRVEKLILMLKDANTRRKAEKNPSVIADCDLRMATYATEYKELTGREYS